jgi:uncharacterized protein
MQFEWDEVKRLGNIQKHGLDFLDASEVFAGNIIEYEDLSEDYDELRFKAYGLLAGFVVHVVYTPRGSNLRIISMRKATTYETEEYIKTTT